LDIKEAVTMVMGSVCLHRIYTHSISYSNQYSNLLYLQSTSMRR